MSLISSTYIKCIAILKDQVTLSEYEQTFVLNVLNVDVQTLKNTYNSPVLVFENELRGDPTPGALEHLEAEATETNVGLFETIYNHLKINFKNTEPLTLRTLGEANADDIKTFSVATVDVNDWCET